MPVQFCLLVRPCGAMNFAPTSLCSKVILTMCWSLTIIGFLNKGPPSTRLARHYSNAVERIEHQQIGVFLAYDSPHATHDAYGRH